MKFLYIDNTPGVGNDSNNGLTPATAWATIDALKKNAASIALGDVGLVKDTGIVYPITNYTTANTQQLYPDTGKNILLTGYPTNTNKPKIKFTYDPANPVWSVSFVNIGLTNIEFEAEQLTGTTANIGIFFTSSTDSYLRNCRFYVPRTGVATVGVNKTVALNSNVNGCEFDFADKWGSITNFSYDFQNNWVHSTYTSPAYNGSLIQGNTAVTTNPNVSRNIFDITVGSVSAATALSSIFGRFKAFFQNTVIINGTAATGKVPLFPNMIATGSFTGVNGLIYSNIFTNNMTSGATVCFNANASGTPITIDYPNQVYLCNNAFYGITEFNYITFTNYPTTADRYMLGANISLPASPFKSETIGNADYCQLDNTTAGNLCKGASFNNPNLDLGRYQSAGSGPTPNAADLRYGVTVGSVVGTLRVPAATDVRYGVLVDATSGTARIPTAANTRSGVLVDATTGTLVVPAVGKVDKGEVFDNGSVGTSVGAPFNDAIIASELPLGVVKKNRDNTITGTDVGAAFNDNFTASEIAIGLVKKVRNVNITGTYVAAERYSFPALNLVVAGTTFKFNSLTDNMTGTRTQIYGLLPTNKVAIGYDRGDGSFGTYIAAEYYSNVLPANVLKDIAWKFQSLTDNMLGTHEEAVSTDPGKENVLKDVEYTINNVDLVGELDIEIAANLPSEDKVLTGSPAYGPNLDKIPAYSPDFPNKANVTSDDTVNGEAGLINKDYVLTSQGGNWVPAQASKYKSGDQFGVNGTSETGTYTGSTEIVPDNKVLADYPNPTTGNVGTLGAIDKTKPYTISMQIRDNALNNTVIPYLDGWKPMAHVEDPSMNNFKTNFKAYGMTINNLQNGGEYIGQETIERFFTLKLMTRFQDKNQSDIFLIAAKEELIAKAEEIRRRGVITQWGNYGSVMCERSDAEAEVEINYEESYVLLELTFSIVYTIDKL